MIKKYIDNFIKNPCIRMGYLEKLGFYRWMSDEKFLKKKFKLTVGQELNLRNPRTFNEKLQWLKLHDHNLEYTKMVDKYEAKKYVAEKIGERYIIQTFGVWNKFDEIDFDSLPNQFVLKCTHDSGGVFICKDKSTFNKKEARRKINKCLRRNYYWSGREWPYKNVVPRILVEEYLEDASCDYKIMCFNGEAKCSFVCTERFSEDGLKVTFFDKDWNKMPFERHYPSSKELIKRPGQYEQMIALAERIAEKIPFVRIDFYESDEKLYFGEITFYPGSGFEEFSPEAADLILGEWIKIPGGYWVNIDNCCLWFHLSYTDTNEKELIDYKFFCFQGKPTYCQVIKNRSRQETIDFFDMEWNHMEFTGLSLPDKPFSNAPVKIPIPDSFYDMKEKVSILANGIPFVRVDFYEVNKRPYFGEMTFYPASGFGVFVPDKWNSILGNIIKLNDL